MSDVSPTRLPLFRFPAPLRRFQVSVFSFQYFASRLRRYFYSGWAFLIPYLAAYLLYYVMKWPVNPTGGGRMAEVSGQSSVVASLGSVVPPLLHVYWLLHAINAVLAAIALFQRYRKMPATGDATPPSRSKSFGDEGVAAPPETPPLSPTQQKIETPQERAESAEEIRARVSAFSLQLSAFLPWLLLALLFYIPGVYLEWPADPWEHYRRINEWSWLHTVGEHSYWAKSSYFLAYSLVGQISPPTHQLFWLDFYYTGVCLLLCWQYYRLARAIGLGERASMLFVILQSVLFGNNIFGFYRYYGISSSIFAQLGAVALTRIAIEYASQKFQVPSSNCQGTEAEVLQEETKGTEYPQPTVSAQPKLGTPTAHGVNFSAFGFQLSAFANALALLALIAFNHRQGLGIAGLGLLAVAIWRLIEWKRSMIWWLAATALALSVIAILCFSRNPAIDQIYRHDGWLTSWYGFNLFAFSLPVGDRSLQILGVIGLVNLAASPLLLRRNHLVGWLTITPILALLFPFIAIPFAGALARHDGFQNIITFQRMLFAIPSGLALIYVGVELANSKFLVLRLKSQGTAAEILQEEMKGTEGRATKGSWNLSFLRRFVPIPACHPKPLRRMVRSWAKQAALSALSFQPPAFAPPQSKLNTPTAHGDIACKQTPKSPPPLFLLREWLGPLLSRLPHSAFPLLLLSLSALSILPANRPFYNRFWQAIMVPPGDLTMCDVVNALDIDTVQRAKAQGNILLLATCGQSAAAAATGYKNIPYAWRDGWITERAVLALPGAVIETQQQQKPAILLVPPTTVLKSIASLSGYLSTHWRPQAAILEYATAPETEEAAKETGGRMIEDGHGNLYSFGDIPGGNTYDPH